MNEFFFLILTIQILVSSCVFYTGYNCGKLQGLKEGLKTLKNLRDNLNG